MPNVVCGLIDWDASALIQELYPEDLPEDWRLTYYANEIPVVLLEQQRWLSTTAEDWKSWVDDAHEKFGFVIEMAAHPNEALIRMLRQGFGSCLLAYVNQLPPLSDKMQRFTPLEHWNIGTSQLHAIALLDVEGELNLKSLRTSLEQWLADMPQDATALLFLRGAQELRKRLNSVQILLELMV